MYKIVLNSSIIDVVDELVFVRYDSKKQMMLLCKEKDAQGILSSDSGVIWHLDGLPPFEASGYATVQAVSISQMEGEALRAQLEKDKPIPEDPGQDQGQTEEILSVPALRTKVIEQEDQLHMLTECLLEMSEAVYA